MAGTPLNRNISLEIVRVTEAAALAAGRWMGRGDKIAGDQAENWLILQNSTRACAAARATAVAAEQAGCGNPVPQHQGRRRFPRLEG